MAIFIALINAIFGGIIANSNMLSTMADEKLLFASTFFASRNTHGQPLGAMIAHVAGMVVSVLWISHVPVLNAMSNLGILIPLGLTIISLFGLSSHSRFTQALCLVGLGSCALLSYYSWMAMGECFDQRLLALSPLVVITLAGFAMYKSNRCAM
jgi:amino acid permease